jgi:uncharacterized protein (TIGR00730 family)
VCAARNRRARRRTLAPWRSPEHGIDSLDAWLRGLERWRRAGSHPKIGESENEMVTMRRICVYCGSSFGNAEPFRESAAAVGRAIATAGYDLVYGGARAGLMGVLADAALAAGGRVIGVMPTAVLPREIAHPGLTEFHEVPTFAERIARFHALSDAFVALPGGFGTLEELFEAISRAQLGQHQKPCALYNVAGYFDPLLTFIHSIAAAGFIREAHRDLLLVADDPNTLLDKLRRYQPASIDAKWVAGRTSNQTR